MDIRDFVNKFVDGYLFSDLATMKSAAPLTGNDGHLGYPILMTCAAGIELFGILVSTIPFEPKPSKNFLRYWEEHLYPASPRREAGNAVYQLVRHGIAHNFATKVAFEVTKGGPHHLTTADEVTIIDACTLADDLRSSFDALLRPIVNGLPAHGISAASVQARLDEIAADNVKRFRLVQASLAALPAPAVVSPPVSITASGLSLGVSAASSSFGSPPPKLSTP
jgi:hypothetical protein